MKILTKATVLVLNRNWQAIGPLKYRFGRRAKQMRQTAASSCVEATLLLKKSLRGLLNSSGHSIAGIADNQERNLETGLFKINQ
jgi:hypothetical protein